MSDGLFQFTHDYGNKKTDYIGDPFQKWGANLASMESSTLDLPTQTEAQCTFLGVRFEYDRLYAQEVRFYVAINEPPDVPAGGVFIQVNSLLNPERLVFEPGITLYVINATTTALFVNVEIFRIP